MSEFIDLIRNISNLKARAGSFLKLIYISLKNFLSFNCFSMIFDTRQSQASNQGAQLKGPIKRLYSIFHSITFEIVYHY